MGDTPTSPGKGEALATTLSWLSPIRHLACGRPSLVRYYAHTERVPPNLKLTPAQIDLRLTNHLRTIVNNVAVPTPHLPSLPSAGFASHTAFPMLRLVSLT